MLLPSLSAAAVLSLLPGPALAQEEACVWERVADCPEFHFDTGSLAVDGQLYLFGGFKTSAIEVTARLDTYDPVTDTWTRRADLPVPVTHVGIALDDRTVWMAGGFVGDHPGVASDAVWNYNVDTDQWSPAPPLPKLVAAGALARSGRSLHYFGGVEADRNTGSADHFVLNLDDPAGGWNPLAPLPDPRNHLSGIALGGYLYALGGQVGHDVSPIDTRFVDRYDPQTDTWLRRRNLPLPRSHHEASTFELDGRVVLAGGKSHPSLQTLMDVTAYDPQTNTYSTLPLMPFRRSGMAAALLGDWVVISCGHADDLAVSSTTLRWHKDRVVPEPLRINCGGDPETFGFGDNWCSDHGFLWGTSFANPGIVDVRETGIDPIYRSARVTDSPNTQNVQYRIPRDDGAYRARLHFAEIEFGATGGPPGGAGSRVFDVVLERMTLIEGLDVAALVGVETALVYELDFYSTGGAVDLRLDGLIGSPAICGFELTPLPAGDLQVICSSSANSTGAPARIGFVGTTGMEPVTFELVAEPVPLNWGLFFYGQNQIEMPLGNGTLCIGAPLARLAALQATNGILRTAIDRSLEPFASQFLPGTTWNFQAWFRDPAARGAGFDLTNGIQVSFAQ